MTADTRKTVSRRYRTLDPDLIIATARTLEQRVFQRFPESGLRGVSTELVALARDLARSSKALEAPIWWVRIMVGAAFLLGAAMFLFVGTVLPLDRLSGDGGGVSEFVQGIEASLNTFLLAGLGFVALVRAEERIKRRRVFKELHSLRSLIHVIDMHQLTKDPAVLNVDFRPTESSPVRITNAADLERYLDYCSEMLSISGKLAALFAQSVNDAVVVDAVNDIEELGSNLSRKIWQKITMIDARMTPPADGAPRAGKKPGPR
ncbi:MAG: hypothetical protein KF723_13975 [Rhizobiaceae bacterium]|nr:hypothetical protein [Rhizobiaceae bacterium]